MKRNGLLLLHRGDCREIDPFLLSQPSATTVSETRQWQRLLSYEKESGVVAAAVALVSEIESDVLHLKPGSSSRLAISTILKANLSNYKNLRKLIYKKKKILVETSLKGGGDV